MAKKIRNISPYGDLDVPLLGVIVPAGEVVEVTDEQAEGLLMQAENWEGVADAPPTDAPPFTPTTEDVTADVAPEEVN